MSEYGDGGSNACANGGREEKEGEFKDGAGEVRGCDDGGTGFGSMSHMILPTLTVDPLRIRAGEEGTIRTAGRCDAGECIEYEDAVEEAYEEAACGCGDEMNFGSELMSQ